MFSEVLCAVFLDMLLFSNQLNQQLRCLWIIQLFEVKIVLWFSIHSPCCQLGLEQQGAVCMSVGMRLISLRELCSHLCTRISHMCYGKGAAALHRNAFHQTFCSQQESWTGVIMLHHSALASKSPDLHQSEKKCCSSLGS